MLHGTKTQVIKLENPTRGLVRDVLMVLLFSVLSIVGTWIAFPLPFTPVPVTLQTFFVLLAGAMLGPGRGAMSQVVYLGYGLSGLPVFAGGSAGLPALLGPTGGYLLAFPIAAFLTGLLTSRNKNFYLNLGGFFLGSVPILFLGTLQVKVVAGVGFQEAMTMGLFPFFAGDFIKSCLAATVFTAKNRLFKK
jgi:biotin transport system substrate-specific component